MKLTDPVESLPQISSKYAKLLAKLEIFTVGDLLTHFPTYHKDTTAITDIGAITQPGKYVIQTTPSSVKSIRLRTGKTMQSAVLQDASGAIRATWFNQPYLEKALSPGVEYLFVGNAKPRKQTMEFYPEVFEQIIPGRASIHLGRITPQYPLTAGISIKWLRNRIKFVVDNIDNIEDIQDELTKVEFAHLDEAQFNQTKRSLKSSLQQIHFPDDNEHILNSRRKLSLLELTQLQLLMIQRRESATVYTAKSIAIDTQTINDFIHQLPFELTGDQMQSVSEILENLQSSQPMNRLLQGDVGSGKTIVAVVSALAVAKAGLQTVILAPTTVLANQHYKSFTEYLTPMGVSIELVTAENKHTEPASILIGTSAVLSRKQNLITDLALVIADEQHRFGVHQREELLAPLQLKLQHYPHCLDMTATPIPRTLALGLFGDLEVSTITAKPHGRLPIKTFVVPETKRAASLIWISEQLAQKRQVYWMCPLVTESDKLAAKSAEATYTELESQFPNYKLGLLHGQMKPAQKDAVMQEFKSGDIDLLVTTSVIEVGIDVPNATVMVIEDADRFGMAQLHQIRGRVGRSNLQSWCFLFVSTETSEAAQSRLEFFAQETDGLRIAEYDLQNRGPGEVYGTKQSGIPHLKIADFSDISQIMLSKELATQLYSAGISSIKLFNHLHLQSDPN